MFVVTKYFYRDKHNFIVTNTCLLCQNMSVVAPKSCKYNFCHDKKFVATNMLQQIFVTTKVLLRQTETCICHDKTLDATKMILVASPTKDIKQPWVLNRGGFNFCACSSLL